MPSTGPLSSLADSRASTSALTSSMETTAATSHRATGSETNRGRGDRHDPGQDHHLFAQTSGGIFGTCNSNCYIKLLFYKIFKEFCFTIL